MAVVCPQCSRSNSPDARYCYFDGASLLAPDSPALATRKTFLAPFVFAPGEACKDFDEFALACDRHWDAAVTMLQQGAFLHFFNGLGRMDLAQVAQEAANFPDRDRGLDQFLARLPTKSLPAAKLEVRHGIDSMTQRPTIDLGTMHIGQNGQFELRLENHGGRLIFGSIFSTCNWLSATDTGEARLFQFRDKASVIVQVKGQFLRAGARSSEGELFIESNAGTIKLKVIANVPIAAFPEGCLAGAKSPRDLAEKAKQAPHQAAGLFANGAVARWYAANGWSYPVQGPATDGLAAVQQFFEALGLSKPPKVFVMQPRINLKGVAGTKLLYQIFVRSKENRAVYAHAKSSTSWCVVKPAVAQGNVVTLPIEIVLPAQAGQTAQALIRVTSNGQQRFDIPVDVTAEAAPLAEAATLTAPPTTPRTPSDSVSAPPAAGTRRPSSLGRVLLHLAPALLLVLVAAGLIAKDLMDEAPLVQIASKDEITQEVAKTAPKAADFKVAFHDEPDEVIPAAPLVKDEPEEQFAPPPATVDVKSEPEENTVRAVPITGAVVSYLVTTPPRTFGISGAGKKLTYSGRGETNTTVVSIDGVTRQIGNSAGRWTRANAALLGVPATPDAVQGTHSTWTYGAIAYHQILEIVPGQPVLVNGAMVRKRDTVLVRWIIHNTDTRPRSAGLRMELDTLIGSNDGVPFTVPGRSGLVTTSADFRQSNDVPDFIQALEYRSLKNPGTIAHLTLRPGSGIEPAGRVSLTRWSGQSTGGIFGGGGATLAWNIPVRALDDDSSVALYWPEQLLKPDAKRTIGFAYGLGAIAVNDKLGLTLGPIELGQPFTITAYVENPIAGQSLKLELPAGLRLLEGSESQPVAAGKTSLVTWKALVERVGEHKLRVVSSTGIAQAKTITLTPTAGGKLALDLQGAIELDKPFLIVAKVTEPNPNQTLTLDLPEGVKKLAGADTQPVPAPTGGAKDALVQWQVAIVKPGEYRLRVASSTGVAQVKKVTIVPPARSAGAFQMLITDVAVGKPFTVSATTVSPLPDQMLTLVSPGEMQRVEGAETQPAQARAVWKVKVEKPGAYKVGVKSTTGITQRKTVVIEPPDEALGRFTFDFVGDIRPGSEFAIKADIPKPAQGQTLTLKLPRGLELVQGDEKQPVPSPSAGKATVTWTVRVTDSGQLPVRIESSTGLTRTRTITLNRKDLFGG